MGRKIMTAEMKKTHRFAGSFGHLATAFHSANIGQGEKVGYTEDCSKERLRATAEHEGVRLYRNPDGSHTAVDESKFKFI